MTSLVPPSINHALLMAGNLLLEDTIERYYQDLEWAEEAHGLFIVRGENVVLLGELVFISHHLPIDQLSA